MVSKEAIIKILKKEKISFDLIQIPPNPIMGDFALPCFSLVKKYKKSPVEIAKELEKKIKPLKNIEKIEANGPYLNFFINKEKQAETVLKEILSKKEKYGKMKKKNNIVLIESPGPNTNKPLHLGHVRNMLLGNALQNVLDFCGNKTKRIDIINDRGVHICKSMLAYKKFGEGKEPNKKSDHFVGDFYVKYDMEVKKDPSLEKEVQEILVKWENNDLEIRKLWKKMNKWAMEGIKRTYKRYGVKIDKVYLESDHYKKGKEIVQQGLTKGIFNKDEKGNIYYSDENIERKIVLRADGTAIYITQDIVLGKIRYNDFHMDKMIYIVASEQIHHFKALFKIFEKLNYPFAKNCYHLAYGMVYLPEGKMKSREGNVVDADNLADKMYNIAKEEVKKRYSNLSEEEYKKRAEMIGMSAIKFYILSHDPLKDFIFNPKESISFDGETGPYVQYTHARISSIIRKSEVNLSLKPNFFLLKEEKERVIIKMLEDFPNIIEDAAKNYKVSRITRYLLDLSQECNGYYHKYKVIQEDKEQEKARIGLIISIRFILKKGLELLGIEAPERM